MQIPIEIAFREVEPTEELEARIREKAARLERYYDGIIRCRVAVEASHRRHKKGILHLVRIDLTVPGREIVVSRDPAAAHEHEDVRVAIRDAFKAARRRLQDYARERRHQTKAHEEPPHGRIARLFAEEGYGFLETPDGHEIYFHRNSVLGDLFDQLDVGDEVRFTEEPGEKGPQATSVRPSGRPRRPG